MEGSITREELKAKMDRGRSSPSWTRSQQSTMRAVTFPEPATSPTSSWTQRRRFGRTKTQKYPFSEYKTS